MRRGMRKTLSPLAKVGFGAGHVLNDMCGTMWFGYGLVWMQDTLKISSTNCGYIILVAQFADAIFNLWVGNECDKVTLIKKFGRRKGWHAIGTLMVLIGIVFTFVPPFTYIPGLTPEWMAVYHMMSCQILFNAGWAIAQIAHLSLIPSLAVTEEDEISLNSIRQAMVYCASILTYTLAGFIIKNSSDGAGLDWSTRWQITTLNFVSASVGFIFALTFLVLTPESPSETPILETTHVTSTCKAKTLTVREWANKPGFFRVGLCYTLTRLMYNQQLLFFPVLITTSLRFPNSYIGFCPLVLYASGMFLSFALPFILKITGKKCMMILSTLLVAGGFIWLEFVVSATNEIWGIAILLGMGAAGTLIMSLSSIVDVIGHNRESSSFIYGTYSVFDKVMNGLAALVTQVMSPCGDEHSTATCHDDFPSFFGRMVMIFTGLAMVVYLFYPKFERAEEQQDDVMGSIIVSNRFQRHHSMSLSYSRSQNLDSERRPLLANK